MKIPKRKRLVSTLGVWKNRDRRRNVDKQEQQLSIVSTSGAGAIQIGYRYVSRAIHQFSNLPLNSLLSTQARPGKKS